MIEPGELHRYFKVHHTATGQDVWLEAGDVRYEATDAPDGWHYRIAADGGYFLAFVNLSMHWGWPLKLDEVEPLPDGQGLWHPGAWEHWGWLCRDYEGSWRQSAGVPIEHRNLSNDGEFCHSCGKAVTDRQREQAA